MKRELYSIADFVGANRAINLVNRNRLTVLCYHGVIQHQKPDRLYFYRNAVTLENFRRQLDYILQRYQPVSAESVTDWLLAGGSLPTNPILITFDDGFRNNLRWAAPELLARKIPAIFFVTTGYIGKTNLLWPQEVDELVCQCQATHITCPETETPIAVPDDSDERVLLAEQIRKSCKKLSESQLNEYLQTLRETSPAVTPNSDPDLYRFMDWHEVRQLSEMGFAIGSHTVTHPILSRFDQARVLTELRESKFTIERETGNRCQYLAYPNGGANDVSASVFNAADEVGYLLGFTLSGRKSEQNSDPFAIGRIRIDGIESPGTFRSRTSGLYSLVH